MELHVKFVSADPPSILTQLSSEGVDIYRVQWVDSLTVTFCIPASYRTKVKSLLDKHGIRYSFTEINGLLGKLLSVRKRFGLLFGLLIFLFVAWLSSGRIFAVRVSGNLYVPEKEILSCAQECGIRFGARSKDIRSEHMKNSLLARIPELQWLGVTTSGCVATIHVKERTVPEVNAEHRGVSSIVSVRSGVITNVIVNRGTPMVAEGESVQAGDVLVSGYTDCGRMIKAEQAEGEVFAHTQYDIEAISVAPALYRSKYLRTHTCYGIMVGKKVIKFCNHSGIQDATCVKMYSEDFWSLPGGFSLPIAFVKERYVWYVFDADSEKEDDFSWLPGIVRKQLLSQMVAGEILAEVLHWDQYGSECHLRGEYTCHEMVGRVRYEEIVE